MNPAAEHLRTALGDLAKANEPLAPHTTFRIGGPVDLWIQAHTVLDLVHWVKKAREYGVPCLVLGKGSNLLVLDGGVRGLVVENRSKVVEFKKTTLERAVVYMESGVPLPMLASQLAHKGWSGLEWAIGVPGTVGGAIVGNAGAHGASIADNLIGVTVLTWEGSLAGIPGAECGFEYRDSRFKNSDREVILSAEFEMKRENLQSCIMRMNAYSDRRRHTQPKEPSVGSMFKNPPGESAGRLIEQAGLKGTRVGNVQVSHVHANFFVNLGQATASQVMQLVELVRERVHAQFGVELELEIRVVGVA